MFGELSSLPVKRRLRSHHRGALTTVVTLAVQMSALLGCQRSGTDGAGDPPAPQPSAATGPTKPLAAGPRCAASDSTCEPLSGGASPNVMSQGYDPKQPRTPSMAALGLSAGAESAACAHDGDCVRGGCGNHCLHWSQPRFTGTCEVRAEIWDHYCGCLEHRCQWFTQPLAHVKWEASQVVITQRSRARPAVEPWPVPYALEADRGLSLGSSQLTECLLKNATELPQQLHFVLEVDALGVVLDAKVTGNSALMRQCFRTALMGAKLLGARRSFSAATAPAMMRGNIRAWVEHQR